MQTNPFADIESDLPWEDANDGLQLIIRRSGQISTLIDLGLQKTRSKEKSRQYLGASRLGVSCERALQYGTAGASDQDGKRRVEFCAFLSAATSTKTAWSPGCVLPVRSAHPQTQRRAVF